MKLTIRILFLLVGWAVCRPTQLALAQNVCASPGKDGATFSASPNTYYPGVGTVVAAATTLSVGSLRTGAGASTTPIGANDLLLVIQMQGADISPANSNNYGSATGTGNGNLAANFTAGQYEYVIAAGGVSGGNIPLTAALRNTYSTAAVNGTNALRTFQVVRVPQYSSLTLAGNIVPAAWDGSTGGIVALDVAGAISLNGNAINASGRGFRGGAARILGTSNIDDASYLTTSAAGLNAQKGEGTAGTPQYVNNGGTLLDRGTDGYPGGSAARGGPGNAGGGGNDNLNNSGGAGGGNGGSGGRGGNSYGNNLAIGGEPGVAFVASGTSLVLGGGGGAGTNNNNSGGNAGFASSGSAGGGIVIVRAGSVTGTGSVVANAAATGTGVANDGGGGGGAGGSILVTAVVPGGLRGLTLSAVGAVGGSTNPSAVANSQHGPGGGGGGGGIFTNGAVATATATGGSSGTTTYNTVDSNAGSAVATSAYNAAAGLTGQVSTSLSLASTGGASGATCSSVINGTIFDDANYGGGTGRTYGTANASAVNSGIAADAIGSVGTTVELYDNAGTFVATTTTTTGGAYSFTGLTAGASYTVRVVNGTVKSARTPGATSVVPVQTFRTTAYVGPGLGAAVADGNRVGGEAPEKLDAAANTGSQPLAQLTAGTAVPQSLATVTPGTSGVDFGFNFDVVVNTNDAGQGSLRQFITNANALGNEGQLAQAGSYTNAVNLAAGSLAAGRAGVALPAGTESSIFMIPAARLTNGVAVIMTASALPQINSTNVAINGATQTFNIGNTNDQLLGTGGTVGTQATALSQLNGPEVQLVGSRTDIGLALFPGANNATVRGLSIYGYANQIGVATDVTGTLIEQNMVGTSARSFTDPGVGVRGPEQGIYLFNSDNGLIRNNLIGYNGGMGIWVQGGGNGSNANTITGNELRGNAQEVVIGTYPTEGIVFDGIELQGASTGNTVSGNLIAQSLGHGIDSAENGVGGNTVQDNTISNNGQGIVNGTGVEGSGLRVYGATNTTLIRRNVLSNNNGSGVLVLGTANNVTISQNATFGNTRLGIDLLTTAEGNTGGTTYYNGATGAATNVSLNDSGDGDTGGNGVLNFPVITRATLTGSGLLVQGFARPGAAIELFAADGTANSVAANVGFGQGITYLGTFTEGSTAGPNPDNDPSTGTYTSPVNGLNQGTDNTSAFAFIIPLTGNFAGLAVGTVLTSTATLNNSTSEFSGNATLAALTGYVYEDVNYGGGAGRPRSASGTSGRPSATVELYNGTALLATTTTDGNGQYAFTTTPGTYTVRVVNGAVSSSRPGYTTALLPVQTYNGTTTRVGGENPALPDAPANTGTQSLTALSSGTATPQSLATVTTSSAAPAGPDFGFNFDVVVNTNDAGQGSLRQFIVNANALGNEGQLAQAGSYTNAVNLAAGSLAAGRAGVALPAGTESSIFMIPAARLTNGVAIITPASALPQVTGPNTALNGATQTFNIGNTNDRLLGAGGPVGTGSAATTLSQLNGPEVQLTGSTAVLTGLNLAGANSQVVGLAIYGFGNNVDDNGNANIATSASNVTITANTLGSPATAFAPPSVANVNANVRVASGTGVSFTNNLVGFAGGTGLYLAPAVTGTTIRGNEIRGNGRIGLAFDGIDSHGSSTLATGNLFADGGAQGFDSFSSAGSNVVTGNTFTNNGTGNTSTAPQETAAARFYGTGNTFSQNVTSGNYGAGVEVASGTTVISRNAIFGNGTVLSANNTAASGQVGIDLLATGNDENLGTAPFVSRNSAATTGANGLGNYPILRTANLVGTNLVLRGYAKAGAVIELFTAQASPAGANATGANFGQGRAFLLTLTEGAATGVNDTDGSTGQRYSGNINGFDQGADTNANGFTFTIPLASLPGGTLAAGTLLTSTATLNGATSEFSGNVAAVSGPLPVVLAAFTAQAGPNRDALLRWTTASEVNSAYFDVERSLDGTVFTSIGRQVAQGTSTRSTSYVFTDAGIAARASGPVYYRLRQVDLDASASYSPVRTVAFGPVAATALSLYPNPAQHTTSLDLQRLPGAATYQVVVLDATGRTVRQLSLGGGQRQPLDLAGLAAGSYYVRVTGGQADGSALRQTLHLTKE